ncbi:hypothetical protein Vretifemale_4637, partial [Volvox reticuliferus]
ATIAGPPSSPEAADAELPPMVVRSVAMIMADNGRADAGSTLTPRDSLRPAATRLSSTRKSSTTRTSPSPLASTSSGDIPSGARKSRRTCGDWRDRQPGYI